MFITKKSLPRRTFLRGVGASVALPLLDAMVPALTAQSKTAAKPLLRFGAVFVPNGAIMEQWIPSTPGDRLRVHADLEAAGAVPGSAGGREQSHPSQSRSGRRRSRDQRRGISDRRVPEENRSGRRQCWCIDRSARRQADRPGHAVPVARAGDGGLHRLHRGVHERVQLRIHQHDLVELADDAAADGVQPAHGLRAHVRTPRHAGAARRHAGGAT